VANWRDLSVVRNHYLGVVALSLCTWSFGCGDDDTESKTRPNETEDGGARDASREEPNKPSTSMSINEGGTDDLPPLPDDIALPIVFIHGFSGSAQQFTSQAMRFVANGYPFERLRAYEHDGAGTAIADFVTGADAVIDEVRAKYKTDKVYLIGHSRGTSVSSMYLSDPARAEKVAKYISEDGAGCASITVPCIAPAQTTNTRAGQTHPIEDQRHVEVATSKESFAIEFEFLFDKKPRVVDIVKQKKPVQISGRAVDSPANTGREGALLDVYEVAADTGLRVKDEPLAHAEIPASGDWGPVTVDPDKYYELVLSYKDSPGQHHFYEQPFLRSSQFVRLRSGPPDSPSRMHTNTGDHHAALIIQRMREWRPDDVLEISTKSKSGDQEPKNVISDASNNRIAIFIHDDAATPGESSLELLPWFPEQAFQTGVDVFMPANDKPDGTITIRNLPRGDESKPQVINVPNWASTNHTISVLLSDFPR
jgi:pimeloyl-ACP methyl ester carboxylesterase